MEISSSETEEPKSNSFRHFYHPEYYRFKEKESSKSGKFKLKLMFLDINETRVRIFDNPSDERNTWKLAQMQFMCDDMLLCTIDAFKKTTVKSLIKKVL